ncbi:MAG: hypothetical protein LBF16_02355, partial [Pseudomonadales bacterium]|nr:hypothetical protein [Pseudomonadales bacterium]
INVTSKNVTSTPAQTLDSFEVALKNQTFEAAEQLEQKMSFPVDGYERGVAPNVSGLITVAPGVFTAVDFGETKGIWNADEFGASQEPEPVAAVDSAEISPANASTPQAIEEIRIYGSSVELVPGGYLVTNYRTDGYSETKMWEWAEDEFAQGLADYFSGSNDEPASAADSDDDEEELAKTDEGATAAIEEITIVGHRLEPDFPVSIQYDFGSSTLDLNADGGGASGRHSAPAPKTVAQIEDEPAVAAAESKSAAQTKPTIPTGVDVIDIYGSQSTGKTLGWEITIDNDDIAYQDETAYYTGNGIKITEDHIIRTDNLNGTATITLANDAEDDTAVVKKDGPVNPNLIDVYEHGIPINLAGEPEYSIIDLGWSGGGISGADTTQAPQDVAQVEDEPPPAVDPPAKDDATLAQNDDEDAPSVIEEITITGHKTEPNDALKALIDDANDARSFGEKVTDAASNVLDAAKQMLSAGVNTVVETAAELSNAALQTVIDLIKDPSSLGEKVTSAAANTAEAFTQLANASANGVANLDLGLLKGLGNLPGDLLNVVVTTFKYGSGFMGIVDAIEADALAAYNDGDVAQANKLAAQAELLREKWQVDDLFALENTAQKVGALLSAVVPIAEVVKVAGVVGKAVQGADKLVDVAKGVDEAADVAKIADGAGDAGHALDVAESVIPRGFANLDEFTQFGINLRTELSKAGYTDIQGVLQGSAVTGTNFRTGVAFDVGRVSDFDIALTGDSLFQAAQNADIGLRSAGVRTGPLNERTLQKLGLFDLSTQLSTQVGRPVNFMIYQSMEAAVERAPSILIPR